MENIKITDNLPVERWEEYKKIGIEAVENDSVAFSTELGDIKSHPDNVWKESLQKALDGEQILLFAEFESKLIGLASVYFYKKERFKHNALLQNLYVNKDFRGKGIGKLLTEKRLEMILQKQEIINVICEIFSSQTESLELHKKIGFEVFGQLKDFINDNGKYYDSINLVKRVK